MRLYIGITCKLAAPFAETAFGVNAPLGNWICPSSSYCLYLKLSFDWFQEAALLPQSLFCSSLLLFSVLFKETVSLLCFIVKVDLNFHNLTVCFCSLVFGEHVLLLFQNQVLVLL
ncbi:hypothetical protein XENOCAPTIV_012039 [Xenoophorus captivus]|uniref:Uncharacterized protein n=1 Tax=Xenoophorus captivus TaxID=1517983 RepID=A0ABV0SGU6_9TELE